MWHCSAAGRGNSFKRLNLGLKSASSAAATHFGSFENLSKLMGKKSSSVWDSIFRIEEEASETRWCLRTLLGQHKKGKNKSETVVNINQQCIFASSSKTPISASCVLLFIGIFQTGLILLSSSYLGQIVSIICHFHFTLIQSNSCLQKLSSHWTEIKMTCLLVLLKIFCFFLFFYHF